MAVMCSELLTGTLTWLVCLPGLRPLKPPPTYSSGSAGGNKGGQAAAASVASNVSSLDAVAPATEGYSGGDLMEPAAQVSEGGSHGKGG